MERASGQPEMLDGPLDERLLAGNLRDLTRANRWLGGAELSWRAVSRVWQDGPGAAHLRLLDVGTGAADIPLALLRRARGAGLRLEVEAVDIRPEIVSAARRRAGEPPGLTISLDETGRLVGREAVDIVHASLVLHHLEPGEAETLLGDMARLARRAVVVNDLFRARRWWLAAALLSRVLTRNAYTRHDAPLSVRRAYQPDEVVRLAERAGLREVERLQGLLGHRYALVFVPDR